MSFRFSALLVASLCALGAACSPSHTTTTASAAQPGAITMTAPGQTQQYGASAGQPQQYGAPQGQPQQYGAPPAMPAASNGPSVVGAWSWTSPDQGGMDQNSMAFNADGSFIRVSRLVNGTMLRQTGSYTAAQVSPTQFNVRARAANWLPTQMCSQAPGFQARCSPAPQPPEMDLALQFTSPDSIQAQGMTLNRDAQPYLLSQAVPASAFMAANAPVQPNMRQPVMPYQPGLAISAANHAGAQAFINGRMRGCTTAPNGQLYGCQQ